MLSASSPEAPILIQPPGVAALASTAAPAFPKNQPNVLNSKVGNILARGAVAGLVAWGFNKFALGNESSFEIMGQTVSSNTLVGLATGASEIVVRSADTYLLPQNPLGVTIATWSTPLLVGAANPLVIALAGREFPPMDQALKLAGVGFGADLVAGWSVTSAASMLDTMR